MLISFDREVYLKSSGRMCEGEGKERRQQGRKEEGKKRSV